MIKSIFAPDGAFQTRGEVKEVSGGVEVGGCYYAVPPFVLTDDPAPVPAVTKIVPDSVTMRQARLALLAAGKLSAVDTAINAMPEPQKSAARIEWDYSSAVQRSNAFVQQLGAALGMSSSQIDDLFITAAKL